MQDSETEPTERENQGSDTSETGGTDTSDAEGTDTSTDGDEEAPVPTRQPTALRRQQLFVGAGGAVLVALAVVVSLIQQFPTLPLPLVLLAGLLGGVCMAWIVVNSVFPGEGEPPEQ